MVSGGVLSLLDGEGSYVDTGQTDGIPEASESGVDWHLNELQWTLCKRLDFFFLKKETKQLFRPGTLLLTLCTMVCNEILTILPTPNIIN